MPRFLPLLAAALVFLAAAPAGAADVVINNGLAPPNPANVIDAAHSFPADDVTVRNVGCRLSPCPMPWGAPTSVELVGGGSVGGRFVVYESSRITMSGGSVGGALSPADSSTLAISGGSVLNLIEGVGSSTIIMTGGSVGLNVYVRHSSTVIMSGGSVTLGLAAFDASTITMTGGSVLDLIAADSSTVTMTGGSVAALIIAYDSATLTIAGSGFAVDGVPVSEGPIAAMSGVLTGTLSSGESIDNYFCHDGSTACGFPTTGLIALVPEPSVALLSLLAVLSLAADRRRRATH